MIRFYVSLALFIVFLNASYAQNLTLQQVMFTGSGFVNVRDDSSLIAYSSPQWTSSVSNPVAIVSGNPLCAGAIFTSTGSLPASILIKAITSDNYELPAVSVSTANPGNITYPVTQALSAFPYHRVKYYNPFIISWDASFDNGITWQNAGVSNNKLYVLYQNPILESGFYYQHTLFEISCSNADNDSLENDIINNVWNEFTDRIVIDAEGDTLGYYSGDVWNPTYYDLVKDNFGICDQWAAFFLDLLKIQGLNYAYSYDVLVPFIYNPTACGDSLWAPCSFLVKDHQVNTPSGNPFTCPLFPYLNVFDWQSFAYLYAEVSDISGMPGQNNSNPPPLFGGHTMVLINGVYYDPSYGISYSSLNDFKLNALTGFAIGNGLTEVQLGIDIDQNSILDSSALYNAMKVTTDLTLGYFTEDKSTYGDLPTGVYEIEHVPGKVPPGLVVFPNPAGSFLVVRTMSAENKKLQVSIHDIAGRKINAKHFPLSKQETQVNVKDFPPGIYFIKTDNEMTKFVKE